MKGKNVLADNPLDLMFAARRPQSAPDAKIDDVVETKNAAPPVAHETSKRVVESVAKPIEPVVIAQRSAVGETREHQGLGVQAQPLRSVGTAPKPESPPVSEVEQTVGSRSRANRIGTLHQPYTRKKDGLETRQASVTLPVEVLRKVGHCAVDHGMKSSEIMRAAVEEYLAARGY